MGFHSCSASAFSWAVIGVARPLDLVSPLSLEMGRLVHSMFHAVSLLPLLQLLRRHDRSSGDVVGEWVRLRAASVGVVMSNRSVLIGHTEAAF